MDELNEIRKTLEAEYMTTLMDVQYATDDEERAAHLRKLGELHKQLIDHVKLNQEVKEKTTSTYLQEAQREAERKMKEEELEIRRDELKSERRGRIIDKVIAGVTCGTGIASLYLTSKWMKTAMKFEETGTFTARSPKWVDDFKRFFKSKG